MWISPNHPDPPRPRETGQRLAVFPRGDDAELRVYLEQFEGHPYVSLRVWAEGSDGRLWPVKGRGVSIRIGEAAGLAEVLEDLVDQLDSSGRSSSSDRGQTRRTNDAHKPRTETANRGSGRNRTTPRPAGHMSERFDEFD